MRPRNNLPRSHAPRVPVLAMVIAVACAFALVCLLLAAPPVALAREYTMSHVAIAGRATEDGDFWVTEARTFDFDGTYHAVYWQIPTANATSIEVEGVGELGADGRIAREYTLGSGEAPGVYNVERSSDAVTVTANFEKSDVSVTFVVQYLVRGGVKAWADTGDVTWQVVGQDWDQSSWDVEAYLWLPVPQDERVELGENVRAWVDGPLDGRVDYDDEVQAVHMTCPRVRAGQYLSVMCAFPVAWLTGMTPAAQEHLDYMMELGAANAEQANAQRAQAQAVQTGVTYGSWGAGILASLAGLGTVVSRFIKHGREYRASFDEKYWRDVPSDDHPAVIGRLWRMGATEGEDLTATLMRLTDMGAIELERVRRTESGLLRQKTVEDYRLSQVPAMTDQLTCDIDRKAMKLVFDTARIGGGMLHSGREEVVAADGSPLAERDRDSFLFSDFASCAKADAQRYKKRYDAWLASVEKACNARGFFEAEGTLWQGRAVGIAVGLIFLAAAIAVLPALATGEVNLLPAIPPAVAGVACIPIALQMPRRSAEANEIAAKTGALRAWLKDFTNLGQAIPTDVVLWDKLLVMAVVLGVSQRVVEQLRARAPQLFDGDAYGQGTLSGAYLWCTPWGPWDSAGAAFTSAAAEAKQLSMAEIAKTEMADAGGGAGGFGGGGFGGSFGGGSFGGGGGGAR